MGSARTMRGGLALAGLAALTACAGGNSERVASPRVRAAVDEGRPIAKGGGVYKVGNPYEINGRVYVPREDSRYDETGVGSWYGIDFHGRLTANGEVYDRTALTAAHRTLPLPSYATVTNLDTGRTLLVRINDRGPYADDRIIDLSQAAARGLGFEGRGLARVRVRYAGPAPLDGNTAAEDRYYQDAPGRYAASQPGPWRPHRTATPPVAPGQRGFQGRQAALAPDAVPASEPAVGPAAGAGRIDARGAAEAGWSVEGYRGRVAAGGRGAFVAPGPQ